MYADQFGTARMPGARLTNTTWPRAARNARNRVRVRAAGPVTAVVFTIALVPVIAVQGLFYTPQPQELRAFLRDVLGWEYVEDPQSEPGWLIFKLPPAELGVHPSDGSTKHELAFMCDDIEA